MKRPTSIAVLAVVLTSFTLGGRADAATDSAIFSGPGSYLTTYTQPVTVVGVGKTLTYVNADIARHDVVATVAVAPVQCPSTPGTCPENTPFWCLPPDPTQPWSDTNPLPYAPGTCPMFWSLQIGIGQTEVHGTEYMESGKAYEFLCTLHPLMKGFVAAV